MSAGMLLLHPGFAWICCGCKARCGHRGSWVTATGDDGHYCYWGLAPLAQAGGSPECRSSRKQQMKGFAQCSLPRALWPQRKDQSGSQGTAGCGSRLQSPCRVRLSLGTVAFPQPIPILSHHSVRMGYSASIGAAPVWPTPWQSLGAQPCHSLSLSRCTRKDTKM